MLPGHPLVAIRSEMVINESNLHVSVPKIIIVVTQKYNLILISQPIVRNGDIRRASSDINQPILTPIQRVMVNPNLRSTNQTNGITVHVSQRNDLRTRPHYTASRLGLAMVDNKPMDYDIGGSRHHQTRIPRDVDGGATAVDGRVAANKKRLVKHNVHVFLKRDPHFGFDHCGAVSEGAWAWG